MKAIIFLLTVSLLGLFSSCKNKKQNPVLTEQKVEVIEEVATPQPVVEEKTEPAPKAANYYLVAGCFRYRENADKLNARLRSQGYDSRIIPFYNLHMVTYEGFQTRREAQVALNRIVSEAGKELTWVYPVR